MDAQPDRRRWWNGPVLPIVTAVVAVVGLAAGFFESPLGRVPACRIPILRGLATCGEASLLYEADWSGGLDGWQQYYGLWATADGTLHNFTPTSQILASVGDPPCDDKPGRIDAPLDPGTADYAVVATIAVTPCPAVVNSFSAGILVRGGYYLLVGTALGQSGISLAVNAPPEVSVPYRGILQTGSYPSEGSSWWNRLLTYRIEVKEDHITASVDGNPIIDVHDGTYSSAGTVGLYYTEALITVSDFRVIKD